MGGTIGFRWLPGVDDAVLRARTRPFSPRKTPLHRIFTPCAGRHQSPD